jgi:glucokinase
MAGELGHIKVMRNQLATRGGCGKNGCVEQLCGENGFIQMYDSGLFSSSAQKHFRKITANNLDLLTPLKMAELAKDGDVFAAGAWNLYGTFLGQAIADTVLNFGIDTIILGGGIAHSLNLFQPSIMKTLSEELVGTVADGVTVVRGTLDSNKAEILGAAALVAAKVKTKKVKD